MTTSLQLFNDLLTPEEKSVVGGEQAGMVRMMADFAKAAYHLEDSENPVINDFSPNADTAASGLMKQGWTALNLHPTLSATSVMTGYNVTKQINSTTTTPFTITISNGMFDDGFYINGNSTACVERCGDAIVLSFRGTNDNGKDGVVNPNDPYNVNNPDKDQWSNMASHYALLQPLITAFDAYVAANGISKVYVTGHSMGGAMALEYMSRHSGSQYQAVTFGAPPFTKLSSFWGVTERKDYAQDSRIAQIEVLNDPVPMAFDIRNILGGTNARPAGDIINFGGNQTLDAPNLEVVPWVSDYYARDANHSMDYYRQITDSVDADSWVRILAGTGTQTVLLGGQEIPDSQNPKLTNFIVDGQLSGTNTSVSSGSEYLASINFKTVYGGNGNDTLIAGTNPTLLLGGVGDDTLRGNTGSDTLTGGAGGDRMEGGLGADTYYVDNLGDVVSEIGKDWDVIYSTITGYTVDANVEVLILSDTVVAGNGNAQNNYLLGNAANNNLDGKAGADVMAGYAGNDTYFVDSANINAEWAVDFAMGDVVVEGANEGIDTVNTSVSYVLRANIENLVLTGNAIGGGGNALNNIITGNAADNILNGGTGVDTVIGGAGNDQYFVDETNDVTTELGGEGSDIVFSTATNYALNANIENLIVWGAGLNGTGNAGDNIIYGNALNNTLADGAGSDILAGGRGKDTYNLSVDNTTDTLYIAAGDSPVTGYDQANHFNLGNSTTNSAGADKLNLDSTAIATDAIVDGVNAGTIMSHSISNGIISFGNANSFTAPITITATNVLAEVLAYLQSNITSGDTVAFVVEGSTFVFQDGGETDTLIELVGVTASSVNTTGLGANAVWII